MFPSRYYLERVAAEKLANFPPANKSLWFAGSDAVDISIHTNRLAMTLESNSPLTLRWKYADERGEKHHTIFRATKEKAIVWTFGDNK